MAEPALSLKARAFMLQTRASPQKQAQSPIKQIRQMHRFHQPHVPHAPIKATPLHVRFNISRCFPHKDFFSYNSEVYLVKKKPRFFCDNCGYEVGSEVKSCPYCGRYFASVRCPSCGQTGPDRMFQNGCPMCGYSAPPPPKAPEPRRISAPRPKKNYYTEAPSAWAYIVPVIAIVTIIALLSYLITR